MNDLSNALRVFDHRLDCQCGHCVAVSRVEALETHAQDEYRRGWQDGHEAAEDNNLARAMSAEHHVELLQALLREYGRHAEGCSAPFGYPCKCGWDRESAALRPEE